MTTTWTVRVMSVTPVQTFEDVEHRDLPDVLASLQECLHPGSGVITVELEPTTVRHQCFAGGC